MEKAEMEAKEVRYVGKLQKGRKFLREFCAHARPCDTSEKRVAARRRRRSKGVESKQQNKRWQKGMSDHVVSQSLANSDM